jgi:signal transduction histidine kinase
MIDVIDSILQQTIRETRSLSFELCPPYLYELGFETALEWLAEQIQKNYNFTIHFESNKELKPMGDDIKVVLFQSTRELLVNIAKHAGARNAWVSVRKDNGNIRINVEDDGIGFDFAEAESRIGRSDGGFGLLSIRERINYLGGHLECESGEGRGTRISLVVPLRQS